MYKHTLLLYIKEREYKCKEICVLFFFRERRERERSDDQKGTLSRERKSEIFSFFVGGRPKNFRESERESERRVFFSTHSSKIIFSQQIT